MVSLMISSSRRSAWMQARRLELPVEQTERSGPAYLGFRRVARFAALTVALILGRLVRHYRARRDAEHRQLLDAHLLKDIGISRHDIEAATSKGAAEFHW